MNTDSICRDALYDNILILSSFFNTKFEIKEGHRVCIMVNWMHGERDLFLNGLYSAGYCSSILLSEQHVVQLSMNQVFSEFGPLRMSKWEKNIYFFHTLSLVEFHPSRICNSKSVMEINIVLMGNTGVWTSARHVIFLFLFVPYFVPFPCHIRRPFFSSCN